LTKERITHGGDFEELLKKIEEAVLLYFEDELEPEEEITILTQTELQVHSVAKTSGTTTSSSGLSWE